MSRPGGERPRRLLIVDDEEDFRAPARRHFERRGYEVREAADGLEALEIFDRAPAAIDLVITDIRMPRLDGASLIRQLHDRRPHLPVLGVTGQADLKETLELLGSGAYYYFEKPLGDFRLIDNLVDNAIQLHRHEEELRAVRRREREIARLVRGYIVDSPGFNRSPVGGEAGGGPRVDVALEVMARDQPSADFVEWFERVGDEMVFYVADASGHDDLAATFLALLSITVLHRIHHRRRPAVEEIIGEIDAALARLRGRDLLADRQYLTFFMGALDLATGELAYVNAGHPDGLLFRGRRAAAGDGPVVERLAGTCAPVGWLSLLGGEPAVRRVRLRAGDTLLLYTDGASDLLGGGDAALGIQQLIAAARPLAGRSARELVDAMAGYLRQASGAAGPADDTTLLAILLPAGGTTGDPERAPGAVTPLAGSPSR